MLAIRLFLFSLAATALAACGPKLKDLPEASFAPVYAPADKTAATATIRGAYREKEGLVNDSISGAYVAMVDGERPSRNHATDPVPLTPGPHSLTMRYWAVRDSFHLAVPFRLDAKPGASYVVRLEEGNLNVENYLGVDPTYYLYIVDETTDEIVSPKMPHLPQRATEFYVEPAAPDIATIRGTIEHGLDAYSAYVLAIDGRYIHTEPDSIFFDDGRNYEGAVALTPGRHALAIGIRNSNLYNALPVLIDIEPGASYVLRFEHGVKKSGEDKWQTFTVWLENEKTAAIVVPKTDMPIMRLPF
ncbi:hypothetical protein [Parvibaculum sp.]|uniref:hypothetical protein n=1 Tax=Parvibaculum sp. TaxID=2024848 RepID=UPI002B80D523|nr:hypothetical protein [Parvibaculum sp.]HUD52863.1 hypothetical protein [Parvibaculum sp.]